MVRKTLSKESKDGAREYAESIINTVREPLIVLDEDLRVITASRSFYEFFKVKPEETVGQHIYDLGNKQWDIPKLRELLETILPQKTIFDNYEVEHDFATIGKRIMLLNARQIQRVLGKERIILLAIEDITKQREAEKVLAEKAEKALSRSEEKYRLLVESINDVLCMLDTQGNITYISPVIERITKYKVDDIIGKPFIPIVYQNDLPDLLDRLNRLKSGQLEPWEFRIVDEEGSIKFVRSASRPIYEKDQLVGFSALMTDITEHKRAEDNLKESEFKYRQIVETAMEGVLQTDKDGRINFVNRRMGEMLGYTSGELIGQPLEKFKFKEDLAEFMERRKERQKGISGRFEARYKCKDGSEIWVFISAVVIKDERGQFAGIFSQFTDITERKQAERELRLRANLLDSAMDSIIVEDLEGTFLYANEAAYKSRGYAKKEFLQMEARQLTAPQDREGFAGRRAKLKEMGSLSFEVAHIRKDGTLMPVDVHVKTVELEGEKVIFSIDRDITERRRGEEMLKDSELKYRRIVETAMEGITQTDKDGRITFVNGRIEAMLGYTAEEIIGQKLTKFIFEEDLAAYIEQRNELRKGIPRRFERRWKRKDDSEIWTSVSTNIIKDKAGQFAGTYALMTDITESRRAQKELAKSYHKMQKAVAGTIQAIALTAETRDPYTAGHQSRVAKLAVAIGEAMGFSKDKLGGLHAAGILHDIGKINVPSEILSKPGKLSGLEMSLIRTHSQSGAEILKTLELPWAICPAVRQHHERMDGSGYPSGLKGEAIVMEARIIAVADVVEAMASHRPYRPALGIDKALEEITKNKGKFYDPDVVDVCLKLFKEKGFKFD